MISLPVDDGIFFTVSLGISIMIIETSLYNGFSNVEILGGAYSNYALPILYSYIQRLYQDIILFLATYLMAWMAGVDNNSVLKKNDHNMRIIRIYLGVFLVLNFRIITSIFPQALLLKN
jgi:hypothetical protein